MSEENFVLREAQLAREGRVEVRHAPFAEHQLRIDVAHFYHWHMIDGVYRPPLAKMFPGLVSKDHAEFEETYDRFFRSSFADPYRVRSRREQLGHL